MIQLLRGTKSQLETSQTVFADGQPVFEKDTGQLKIGNGTSTYSLLPYVGTSSGGSSSEILYSGDVDNGWIDFPSGLRYSWLVVRLSAYQPEITENPSGIYYSTSTMSTSRLLNLAGVSANWKSVVLDQIINVDTSTNQRSFMLSHEVYADGFGSFNVASLGTNAFRAASIRIHTWSHD